MRGRADIAGVRMKEQCGDGEPRGGGGGGCGCVVLVGGSCGGFVGGWARDGWRGSYCGLGIGLVSGGDADDRGVVTSRTQ
ncbi:hypothetical protein EX30DRAFT_246917 [Ascodesmis nigricans]|uniref:Uncharacterized protein n=1 Tax=Ascodesmis nigricans TaxID=341454 RepID=A0A4S2MQ50_9PEZI|nr:hypothetical protein EX30DRAFT_246917 [Ascodesmis nigricans]